MKRSFDKVLADAIADFEEHGFDDEERLVRWEALLLEAINRSPTWRKRMDEQTRRHLRSMFDRLVKSGQLLRVHPGVSRFTLSNLDPSLHAELERRIHASAQLIRLNRDQAITKTLQRFSAWATSVPAGGTPDADRRKLKQEFSKPLKSLAFQERRVLIDQGHKLNASLSAVVAQDGGAIAARWFSHWRQANYDFREDHKDRDGKIYLLRGSWAQKGGLVKPGPAGWADDITQPGEEVFCRCKFVYLYHLRQLPDDMLTAKGRAELKRVKAA